MRPLYRIVGLAAGAMFSGGVGSALDPLAQTPTITIMSIVLGAAGLGYVLGAIADAALTISEPTEPK